MDKYITLLEKYITQTENDILKTNLLVNLEALRNGIMPNDTRIKFSLILESTTLLPDTTNFTDLALVKTVKCKEIDSVTEAGIIALVGDDIKQRNLASRAIQLTFKALNSVATPLETQELSGINSLLVQVDDLRATGNNKEQQIQATTTVETFNAKCVELNV